jgi:hypothetical protein
MKPVTEKEVAELMARHHAQQASEARSDFWLAVVNWGFILACLAVSLYGLVKFIKWAWES